MGKNSNELWDDSTLIDAFDQAVFKYKKMHAKARGENPSIDEDAGSPEENGSISLEKTKEGCSQPSETNNAARESMTETSFLGSGSENLNLTLHPEVSCGDEELPMDHIMESLENKKTNVDPVLGNKTYNELLSEYYRIENQRQTLLHQLHQANYCDSHAHYSNASHSILQGDYSAISGNYNGYQGYYPTDHSLPYCSYRTSEDKANGTHTQDVTTTEKVLCSSKLEPSASNLHKVDLERESGTRATCDNLCLPSDSETDLSVVLSAWYTAGFHTGRYLLEESLKKGRR